MDSKVRKKKIKKTLLRFKDYVRFVKFQNFKHKYYKVSSNSFSTKSISIGYEKYSQLFFKNDLEFNSIVKRLLKWGKKIFSYPKATRNKTL
jgi:hypothetical protein